MSKAEEFINQEETIGALTKAKAVDLQSQPNGAEVESKAFSGKNRKNTKSPKTYEKKIEPFQKQSQSQDQRWTPLNTTLSAVLMEVRRDPNFRWLAKMRTPLQR